MPKDHLLALDQGTTSSRAIVFHRSGRILARAQREFQQIFPQPGWVEHDPEEIWRSQFEVAQQALADSGLAAGDIAAIGIANQRETTVLWNRRTKRAIHNAIVWQDRRTEPLCEQLRRQGWNETVAASTGLVIDPYFSATKIRWLLDHVDGAHIAAAQGELAFGTIDSWLLYRLTEGRVHATDVSNAARTLLFDVRHRAWDPELLKAFHVPDSLLPQVFESSHRFGETTLLGAAIPIAGMAGDQQAALFGQACFEAGMAKNTYGTGCFTLMHTGSDFSRSRHGLISTAVAQAGGPAQFALEGSVFVAGAAVQWLRDGLGLIRNSRDIETLARSVPDSGGVMFVPAFTGLGAPYWDAEARGTLVGLTRGSKAGHIARAALEGIAYQSAAVLAAMAADGTPLHELRVDGGACVNDLLMQFQADLLGIPVLRPKETETTALGAAHLAGLACGVFASLAELTGLWSEDRRFEPVLSRQRAADDMARWERAVRQARAR
jgi:glycerol kinase